MSEVDEQLVLDIAEWAAALPDDDEVHVDPRAGHIRVGEVIFADLGSTLDLWSYRGHRLTPGTARRLGRALADWADKRATA
jgi:hypothetical protein